ncbi:MAG: YgiT-type zinc finger protein [Syntrophomonas sp.]|uniref:YgiT-type zinc finger protein n=1 Tax=Syntrophomonas sp. TaxID=2053627 RepID=UPI00260E24C8|nr:YgiT-type zinc finger protein [Syntrophomonas sp.]MDD2510924.1 YgiT-type zinc finger protein [Syntrophomonas sp.]MDD4626888.1 YgiT-type zinc finger protein [Syntrophomonas sp.]
MNIDELVHRGSPMTERLCHCGGTMTTMRSNVDREISGKKVTINEVPVLECNRCKETLYRARTIKVMDRLIRQYPDKDLLLYSDPADPSEINEEIYNMLEKVGILGQDWLINPDAPISFKELLPGGASDGSEG